MVRRNRINRPLQWGIIAPPFSLASAELPVEQAVTHYIGTMPFLWLDKVVHWTRLAAEQGYADAQNNLGSLYHAGEGIEQDVTQAVHWYRLAAGQGLAGAQTNLGSSYKIGEGVEQDDEQAVFWYRLAAKQGNADAQSNLGAAYGCGNGVEQDDEQAVHWYRLAAEQGHADAQDTLGLFYLLGEGVEQDDEQAAHWFRSAADQGHADAQTNLGISYALGQGVEQDDEQAVHWFRSAVDQGHADAQNNLGISYFSGRGVEKDYEQAVHWWRSAAEQGNADAQNALGAAYGCGDGVEQDDEQAVHWYRLAAEQENEYAKYQLALIENANGQPTQTAEIIKFPEERIKNPTMLSMGILNAFQTSASFNDLKNKLKKEIKEEILFELKNQLRAQSHGTLNISMILDAGENLTVEYKETFSFNTRERKSGDDRIRHALLREIAAFLNTEGGVILIGVSDNQRVTGIECDDFKDPESYIRKISQVIAAALGETAATLTQIEIHEYDEKKICSVKCLKSTIPVYCEYKNIKQQTFIRIGNVTTQPPPKEWVDYCQSHFK